MKTQHAYSLVDTNPDGSEIWECSTCGRKVCMHWEPFDLTELVVGDIHVQHTGGKGGLSLGADPVRGAAAPPRTIN